MPNPHTFTGDPKVHYTYAFRFVYFIYFGCKFIQKIRKWIGSKRFNFSLGRKKCVFLVGSKTHAWVCLRYVVHEFPSKTCGIYAKNDRFRTFLTENAVKITKFIGVYSWNRSSRATFPCMLEVYFPGLMPPDEMSVNRKVFLVFVTSRKRLQRSRIHST